MFQQQIYNHIFLKTGKSPSMYRQRLEKKVYFWTYIFSLTLDSKIFVQQQKQNNRVFNRLHTNTPSVWDGGKKSMDRKF